MTITVQPGQRSEYDPRPYPFHVDENGLVGRQDFWRGRVHRLIGFVDAPGSITITLHWLDAVADPQRAVGKYAVTADSRGRWSTHQNAIASMRVQEG